jgi:hypothetical protein
VHLHFREDKLYKNRGEKGVKCLPLTRSDKGEGNTIREQKNAISSFLDLANVYGYKADRAKQVSKLFYLQ